MANTLISGTRWYRAYPTSLTQTLIAANNGLWEGGDPNPVYPYASMNQIQAFTSQSASSPVSFASVRDPALNPGSATPGGDILIICGFTGPFGFATGTITLKNAPTAGQALTITLVGGGTISASYTTLAEDNTASVAQNLSVALNNVIAADLGAGFAPSTWAAPYELTSTITIGASISGTASNAYTYAIAVSGSGISATPGGTTNLTGGGASTSAPLKYDGTTVSGLSYQIQQPFTNCVAWHNHVWYWGDPANPDTLFASDINQPEGFVFMTEYGGYDVGVGDGDPSIRACAPVGNILYVLKADSIYAITGYDFQGGEYQFQLQPAFYGVGTPTSTSVTVLKNTMLFWSGKEFCRVSVGAFDVERIGSPIPVSSGAIIGGNSQLIRAVAGDFIVEARQNEGYTLLPGISSEVYSSMAYFACDIGNGVADTVFVYDDEASARLGEYAWSIWSGWTVGCWIPFGAGLNTAQTKADTPYLCWCDPVTLAGPVVHAMGTDPAADSGLPISFFVQTGWDAFQTPALQKQIHRLFLECEATSGVRFAFAITPSVVSTQSGSPSIYGPYQAAFGATGGTLTAETHQTLIAAINPFLRADSYLISVYEYSGTSSLELVSFTADYIEEPFLP